MQNNLFEIPRASSLQNPPLIVGWHTQEDGKTGATVIDFLNVKLGGQKVAGIKSLELFPLEGAVFKDILIQVPDSEFWACEKENLLIFKSDEPKYEQYKFLNSVLDLAEFHYEAKELYTVSGTVSPIVHTARRRIIAAFNQPEFQNKLQGYGLTDMTTEGSPTVRSYLLWVAKNRGFPGVTLWTEVPFYLASREDPQAIKLTLSFLDRRFNLGLDLRELDEKIRNQNEKITKLRQENTEINKYISLLEKGVPLSKEEQIKLIEEVSEFL